MDTSRFAPVHGTGSMGSEYWGFHVPPDLVPRLAARLDWNEIGRRVFIDSPGGLITLIWPSSAHEIHSRGTDMILREVGEACGLAVACLGQTRWRARGAPENTGAEPDACFYLGEKALAMDRAVDDGPGATDAFADRTPPDLVVEVEHLYGDERKPGFYRALGVPEMWRIDIGEDGLEIGFLDLQAKGGPQPATGSGQVPACTREFVTEALPLAARGRHDDLRALVDRAVADGEQGRPGPP